MSNGKRVSLIGVPFGLGGKRLGASLGPAALRFAGMQRQLERLAPAVRDRGDVEVPRSVEPQQRGEGIGYFDAVFANLIETRKLVMQCLQEGDIPLMLGGDHSLAIASISTALEQFDKQLGVLWIDAHADLNTPDTSPSMDLHGMPLAALCGLPCGKCEPPSQEQWDKLLQAMVPQKRLQHTNIVWIGLRDVDPGERERILAWEPEQAVTMHEIDRYGIASMVRHAVRVLSYSRVSKLWVSLDVDVLDPLVAPGTGTGVRGGFSYREAHLLAELLYDALSAFDAPFELAGIDIAEVNPVMDRENETAAMAVEWVMSLFGKRIMPNWPRR